MGDVRRTTYTSPGRIIRFSPFISNSHSPSRTSNLLLGVSVHRSLAVRLEEYIIEQQIAAKNWFETDSLPEVNKGNLILRRPHGGITGRFPHPLVRVENTRPMHPPWLSLPLNRLIRSVGPLLASPVPSHGKATREPPGGASGFPVFRRKKIASSEPRDVFGAQPNQASSDAIP